MLTTGTGKKKTKEPRAIIETQGDAMNLPSDHGHYACLLTFLTAFQLSLQQANNSAKSFVARTSKKQLCVLTVMLFALSGPVCVLATTPPPDASYLIVEPGTVQVGMTYDVYIKRSDQKKLAAPTVEASQGSGVAIKEPPAPRLIDDDHTLVVRVEIRTDAAVATTKLRVKYKDESGNAVESAVDLKVVGKQPLPPQPTPEGLRKLTLCGR
jgi:hypothetical protein